MMHSSILINVCGPTAVGKTSLAIALAKYFHTDIISSDSRQFYKEMSIGTAKPSLEELSMAKHHFIGHKSIFDSYSSGKFEKEALTLLERLFNTQKVVCMVGGSSLYSNAVIRGIDAFPKISPKIRLMLRSRLETEGLLELQKELKALDQTYYEVVDIQNPHRVIRALEVCLESGKPYSSFINKEKPSRFFTTISVGLQIDRETLYERINRRVDKMLDQGLKQEARTLYPYRKYNALHTVGYREWFSHFEGALTLEETVEEIKKNTRRFAKKQLTWLRKAQNILWFDYKTPTRQIIKVICDKMEC